MQKMLSHDPSAVLRNVSLFAVVAWMKEMGRNRRLHVLPEAAPMSCLANVVHVRPSQRSCTSRQVDGSIDVRPVNNTGLSKKLSCMKHLPELMHLPVFAVYRLPAGIPSRIKLRATHQRRIDLTKSVDSSNLEQHVRAVGVWRHSAPFARSYSIRASVGQQAWRQNNQTPMGQ